LLSILAAKTFRKITSGKGKKSAKGMANDDSALASAIATHSPVAAAAAVPIALISAAHPH